MVLAMRDFVALGVDFAALVAAAEEIQWSTCSSQRKVTTRVPDLP